MKFTYDAEADALYISLDEATSANTVQVAKGVHMDFDAERRPIGVEILFASKYYSAAALQSIAAPRDELPLSQVAKESGVSAETWKKQLQAGRVKGRKIGRDWVVDRAEMLNYLESRDTRGRQAVKRRGRRTKVA